MIHRHLHHHLHGPCNHSPSTLLRHQFSHRLSLHPSASSALTSSPPPPIIVLITVPLPVFAPLSILRQQLRLLQVDAYNSFKVQIPFGKPSLITFVMPSAAPPEYAAPPPPPHTQGQGHRSGSSGGLAAGVSMAMIPYAYLYTMLVSLLNPPPPPTHTQIHPPLYTQRPCPSNTRCWFHQFSHRGFWRCIFQLVLLCAMCAA